ncbi:unnamed protein product [Callosobruchus maculatus]|uniref:Uncharacterized protein n=1 Tax=Callosobruchus maculatus TaxID=64391 RepID=A0A653DMK6_CALMS|nr:unnamed protein product [Callosobruchus maculatus]
MKKLGKLLTVTILLWYRSCSGRTPRPSGNAIMVDPGAGGGKVRYF